MTDLNLVYNTPQDKLLIMLLERITALEDHVNKQTEVITELASISKSDVFVVSILGKYTPEAGYADVTKIQDELRELICSSVPCNNIYACLYPKNSGASLALYTKEKYLLRGMQTMLTSKLQMLVDVGGWKIKHPHEISDDDDNLTEFTHKIL